MFDLSDLCDLPATAVGCVDELAQLERMKSAICARQAELAVRLDDLTPQASDRGTGAQVGLARREAPHRGRRLLELGRGLAEMPRTAAALARGEINERRAEVIVRESRDLALEDRRELDTRIAPQVADLGDTEVQLEAQRLVMRIDEGGAARRQERARARRRVTGRRLPDGQGQVTAVVSDLHLAAIMGSLHERASTEIALGCDRSRAQIVADLFVERLTGQVTAQAVPVHIDLVVSAQTLLGDGDEPGEVVGHGPVPASVARRLVLASPDEATTVRRLFADTDNLVAMESTRRCFDGLLRHFVQIRDRFCRTRFCGAPIRHIDHVLQADAGGATSALNADGLCEGCNYVKEEPGWRQRVLSGPLHRHLVETTTPTGHVHRSRAPALPEVEPANPRDAWVEREPGVWTRAA